MIIGLTGGIASGKSTVSSLFLQNGIKVFDADKIAKNILNEKEIQNKLKMALHKYSLDFKDRKKLREIVFKDEEALKTFNGIIHPEVIREYQKLNEIYLNSEEIVVFDIPLLFETGLQILCNYTLAVVCDEKIQIDRLIKRDKIDEKLALKMIRSQMTNIDKISLANFVIENNGTFKDLEKKVDEILNGIKGS